MRSWRYPRAGLSRVGVGVVLRCSQRAQIACCAATWSVNASAAERAALLEQILAREARYNLSQHRPLAHLLADMHPVLDGVGLGRIGQQTGTQGLLRLGEPPGLLEQAGALVDQGDACLVRLERLGPGLQRDLRPADLFEQKAKIDRGGVEIRLQRERATIGQDGVGQRAGTTELHAEIEPGAVQHARPTRVDGDPAAVECDRRGIPAVAADPVDGLDDLFKGGDFELDRGDRVSVGGPGCPMSGGWGRSIGYLAAWISVLDR